MQTIITISLFAAFIYRFYISILRAAICFEIVWLTFYVSQKKRQKDFTVSLRTISARNRLYPYGEAYGHEQLQFEDKDDGHVERHLKRAVTVGCKHYDNLFVRTTSLLFLLQFVPSYLPQTISRIVWKSLQWDQWPLYSYLVNCWSI